MYEERILQRLKFDKYIKTKVFELIVDKYFGKKDDTLVVGYTVKVTISWIAPHSVATVNSDTTNCWKLSDEEKCTIWKLSTNCILQNVVVSVMNVIPKQVTFKSLYKSGPVHQLQYVSYRYAKRQKWCTQYIVELVKIIWLVGIIILCLLALEISYYCTIHNNNLYSVPFVRSIKISLRFIFARYGISFRSLEVTLIVVLLNTLVGLN